MSHYHYNLTHLPSSTQHLLNNIFEFWLCTVLCYNPLRDSRFNFSGPLYAPFIRDLRCVHKHVVVAVRFLFGLTDPSAPMNFIEKSYINFKQEGQDGPIKFTWGNEQDMDHAMIVQQSHGFKWICYQRLLYRDWGIMGHSYSLPLCAHAVTMKLYEYCTVIPKCILGTLWWFLKMAPKTKEMANIYTAPLFKVPLFQVCSTWT